MSAARALQPRARRVLDAIETLEKRRQGIPPSLDEIGREIGKTGPAVTYWIKKLRASGHITMRDGEHRTIRTVPQRKRR